MKNHVRLDYERFADALVSRGLADRAALKLVLEQASVSGGLFTEILVQENLVSDWEVSKVAAEVFNLPFLPVGVAPPNRDLLEEIDHDYLRIHCLVPIERFGDVLTVSMPGIVTSAVLNGITTSEVTLVLPVVGLVSSNRNWLVENLPAVEAVASPLAGSENVDEAGAWADLFDAGDEAVHLNLPDEGPAKPGQTPRKIVLDDADFS